MILALASAVWLAASLPSAAAKGDPHDARATWSYLQAEDAFFRTALVDSHQGTLAVNELTERVAKECPGVASGALHGTPSEGTLRLTTKLHEETEQAVLVTVIGPDLPAYRRLGLALARLGWSNRRLTALVRRLGRTAEATSELRPPDLCGDLEEWAASGYTRLPAGTGRFLAQFAATQHGGDARERVARMLRPYEGPRGRSLQRHVAGLSGRLGPILLAGAVPALGRLQARLGFTAPVLKTPALTIQPPPSVVQSGGERLSQFHLGSTVAAVSGCLACHRIGEAGNPGPGPDLTHIGSKLTGTQIARALIDPKAPMPSFRRLPRKKFEALVEFLSVLR